MFDESFSSALSYTSRPYAEAVAMRPEVTYTLYATSSKEQTGDVITFAQFEEEDLLSETRNDTESGDESDSESIMMSKKDMESIDETENFDDDLISTETLHDIRDVNKVVIELFCFVDIFHIFFAHHNWFAVGFVTSFCIATSFTY